MYIDTLFPDGVYHALLPRQTYSSCWGGLGQGECRGSSDCKGLVYTNQCVDNKGDECCLQRHCTVPEGTGYCRDTNNQTCDGGTYFAGSGPPWPCPGISSIQCCVAFENMSNGTSTASSTSTSTSTSPTSTSNSTSTSSTPSTSSPTTSAPAPATQSKQGLSGSQIGGIVGGVVGAVLLLGIIALFLFFRRRRGQEVLPQEGSDVQGPVSGAGKPVGEDEGVGKDVPMLEGSMRQEMDAQGAAALHEMEGATERGMVGVGGEKGAGVSELEGQRTVVAELDGASVIRGSGG